MIVLWRIGKAVCLIASAVCAFATVVYLFQPNAPRFGEAFDYTMLACLRRSSMHNVVETLRLAHLFVVCPTTHGYPAAERISVPPATQIVDLPGRVEAVDPL